MIHFFAFCELWFTHKVRDYEVKKAPFLVYDTEKWGYWIISLLNFVKYFITGYLKNLGQ